MFKSFVIASIIGSVLTVTLIRGPSTFAWTVADFQGRKMDYAYWVKSGGEFSIWGWDVEKGTFQEDIDKLVNKALLYLAFRDEEAKKYYHDTLMNMYKQNHDFYVSAGGGDRSLCDILESYILMRTKGVFSISEQRKIEEHFKKLAYKDREIEVGTHQAIEAGLNALTGYILDTTKTGVDHSKDVRNMWNYAKRAKSFDDTWSLPENSLHYIGLIIKTMFRVAVYTDGGAIIKNNKENLKKTMEWIIDVFPHNGFAPSFGRTFYHDHIEFLMDALHAGSYYLRDYDLETAQNCKWLATKMFEYGISHPTPQPWGPRDDYLIRSNPIWLWKYIDDSLEMVEPDLKKHGSKAVYRLFGRDSDFPYDVYDGYPLEKRLDKIILRDSWNEDALYIQVEAAPDVCKNEPYGNSITNFVYGTEAFSSGHTMDIPLNRVWTYRNVIAPCAQKTDATLSYLYDYPHYVASKTSVKGWDRHIGLIKKGYAVVYDFCSQDSTAYWHLQGTPVWHKDYVELVKGDYQLNVYYPNNGWYSVSHYDKYTWNKGIRDQYWYVGDPSRELELKNVKTFAVVLYPYRNENPLVTAIAPTQNGIIWIEAEDANFVSSEMMIGLDNKASKGKYIYAPDISDPEDEGYMEYQIDILTPGIYKIWARCYWPDGAANSFFVSTDEESEVILGNDQTFNFWHWVPGPLYRLSTGKHILKIRDREDGSRLDKILLTDNTVYVPTGMYGESSNIYPGAVGVKLVSSEYTDWNGASYGGMKINYDIIATDAVMFWVRNQREKWLVSFVKGRYLEIQMKNKPISIKLNGHFLIENEDWVYVSDNLVMDLPFIDGTIEILEGI